jgi:peptidyl-dipeptidase A
MAERPWWTRVDEVLEERTVRMSDEAFGRWLELFLEEMLPLERSYSLALWRANTTGRREDEERLVRVERAYRGLFSSSERYRFLNALWQEGTVRDPLLSRQLDLLRREFLANQTDEHTLRKMVSLRVEIESLYNNFRATLGGKKVTENRLREILRSSKDDGEVRTAWEASKQIGPQVAAKVLELVGVRNSIARRHGFSDYQQMALRLDEIEPDWLFRLLDELAEITAAPFKALKERIDLALAARFGLSAGGLRPWHYGDPFFQSAPRTGAVDLDEFYRERDLPALTTSFYDGLGLNIRDILDQSDLYERDGKCQHAFCTDIDRRGDVRVLCNLKPNEQWMGTMLHEFGHAVYDKEFDAALPHVLRGPAHTLSTEAIAMMFGRAAKDRRFLVEIAGVDAGRAAAAAAEAREELRAEQLIFIRWALVVVHFERELYRDQTQDLNAVWWDLVERFQGLRRPAGREEPDWATKIHIATSPVYYQNYILGELTASQLQRHLLQNVLSDGAETGVGGLIGRREVGDFLRERVFRLGRRYPWDQMLERATGSRLEVDHFLAEVSGSAMTA